METWADLQRMEDGLPPQPLAFDTDFLAEEAMAGDFDEEERAEVLREAMERDMADRYGRCTFCDGLLQPAGACLVCASCGETTGCS